jgi:hypothetical protein
VGCEGGKEAAGREVPTKRNTKQSSVKLAKSIQAPSSKRRTFPEGTFRTLCVRSCDGYYFPVSYSTTGEHFEDDQQACQQMCPAGDAELFYHKVDESSHNMVDLDGSRYVDLPSAFSYRTELNPECSCQPAEIQSASISSRRPDLDFAPELRGPVLPQPRPAPGEDPETLFNRAGALVPITDQGFAKELLASQRPGVRVVHPGWNETTVQVMQATVPN